MQEPKRLLARLNPITVDWQNAIRVTGDVLRAEDIAAALSGMEKGPYRLCLYLWGGDASVQANLYELLLAEVKYLAGRENWKHKNDEMRLLTLVKMAMYEVTNANKCNSCKGTGFQNGNKCFDCNGKGKKRNTQSGYAKYCGVKVSNWKKCWEHKFYKVQILISEWEEIGILHLLNKL